MDILHRMLDKKIIKDKVLLHVDYAESSKKTGKPLSHFLSAAKMEKWLCFDRNHRNGTDPQSILRKAKSIMPYCWTISEGGISHDKKLQHGFSSREMFYDANPHLKVPEPPMGFISE